MHFYSTIYQFGTDLDNDGRVSPSEQLKYDDKMGSDVFKAWTPFDHPDLGKVEIGGWKKFGQNNPLPPYLDDEVDRCRFYVNASACHTIVIHI